MRVIPSSSPPGARPSVILVDDDPAVAHAVQFSFDLEGLEVRGFSDAAGLLAAELPGAGCLVLDYHLPDMDGLELLERLRERGVRLPAVLMTTNPRMILKARAAAAGVPIIEKPLLTDALLTAVRRALAQASGADAEEAGEEEGDAGAHHAEGGEAGAEGGDAGEAVVRRRSAYAGGPAHVLRGQAAEDGRGGGEDESEGQKGEAERTGIGAVACVHGGLQNPSRP